MRAACIAAVAIVLACIIAAAQENGEEGTPMFTFEGEETPAEETPIEEEPAEEDTEPEKSEELVESLCRGCVINDECVRAGVQMQAGEGGESYYCGIDYKSAPVKGAGEGCSRNYECASYSCKESACEEPQKDVYEGAEKPLISSSVLYIAGAAAMFMVLLVIIIKISSSAIARPGQHSGKFSRAGGSRGSRAKPSAPEEGFIHLGGRYRYRPELDELEQELRRKIDPLKRGRR